MWIWTSPYDKVLKMLNLYRENSTLLPEFGGFSLRSSDVTAWASDEAAYKRNTW